MTDHNSETNPLTPDDPRLTAYALGELDTEEAKALAAQVDADPELAALVQTIREGAEQVEAALAAEHLIAPNDTDAATSSRFKSPTAGRIVPERKPAWKSRRVLLAAGLALAAGAAITTIALMDHGPNHTTPDPIVQADPEAPVGVVAVSHAMNANVVVDFEQVPLGQVVAYLHKQTGVPISVDWDAIALRGVTAKTPVTLQWDEKLPASSVLSAALRSAWAQSPHPDPADWAVTDLGVSVSPKSSLVQERLDASAKLLAERRFSQAPINPNLLKASRAEVWESDLWNQVLAKRDQASLAVLAEAESALDAAENAAEAEDYDVAANHGMYAYQALAANASLLSGEQVGDPLSRINTLQQVIFEGKRKQDDAALAKAVEEAKATGTIVGKYEAAMLIAVASLESQDYQAANDAVILARTTLTAEREEIDAAEYTELTVRAARLQVEIQSTRDRQMAEQLALIERERRVIERNAASDTEKRKIAEVTNRLSDALKLQSERRYAEAADQLEAALFLDPDNAVVSDLRDSLVQTGTAFDRTRELDNREVSANDLGLLTAEANFSFGALPSAPDEWKGKFGREGEKLQRAEIRLGALGGELGDSAMLFKRQNANNLVSFAIPAQMELAKKADLGKRNSELSRYYFESNAVDARSKPQSELSRFALAPTASPRPAVIAGVARSREVKLLTERWERDELDGQLGGYRDTNGRDDYLNRPIDSLVVDPEGQGQRGQEGEVVTRRDYLQKELKGLEEIEVTDELAEAIKSRRQLIEGAMIEAQVVEPFERDRINAINDLREIDQRFNEETRKAMIDGPIMSRDAYALVNDNPFRSPGELDEDGRTSQAISTFSVDVDTAAYTLVRRQLTQQNQLPVPAAIRIEEMLNYFDYNYEAPVVNGDALKNGVVTQASLEAFEKENADFKPFATHLEVTECPWQPGHQLVRVGIKGMEVAQDERPSAHLTFLMDVSGSMGSANKLPLVKESLKLLLDKLNEDDHVSIVVYAGASGLVLENASAADKGKIEDALNRLSAGGSTAGAAGIQLAYDVADRNYIKGGVNRVILCTDGDFNVGIRDTDDLVALIKDKANPAADEQGVRKGVYLSVLGYGMGNLNDAMMEPLTNAGNGNYAYIDTLQEATKVMYDQAGSTMVTIAKDVKVQVHFDASQVLAYRLIGYENRILAAEDFANDKVDAGDIGAGHSVTALYEVVPFDFDGAEDEEAIRVVKQQIDDLEDAVALNKSLLQTASLTQEQATKLAGATRLLEQEFTLACAVVDHLEGEVSDQPAVNGGQEDIADDADAPDAADQPAAPVEVDKDAFIDGAMMAVKLRYKPVDAPAEDGTSRLIETKVYADDLVPFVAAEESTRFAASVAGFGMVLRDSPHKGNADLDWVIDTAAAAKAHDPGQLRSQFIKLAEKADELMPDEPVEVLDPGAPR